MEHTPGPTTGDITEAKATIRNYTITLEKRLNEIRRLEAVNKDLLEALETLMPLGDVHQKDGWASDFDKALAVIKAAK